MAVTETERSCVVAGGLVLVLCSVLQLAWLDPSMAMREGKEFILGVLSGVLVVGAAWLIREGIGD